MKNKNLRIFNHDSADVSHCAETIGRVFYGQVFVLLKCKEFYLLIGQINSQKLRGFNLGPHKWNIIWQCRRAHICTSYN